MRPIRLIVTVIILITGVCAIPCILPADFSGKSDQPDYDVVAEARTMSNGVTDISACQNGCRMRYGSPPPMGNRPIEGSVATASADEPESVEQTSPTLYIQCMEQCERDYWAQFEEETTKRRR